MKFIAIAIGGFFGAISRYEVGVLFSPFVRETGFPWGTLMINLVGCFVLALFLTLTLDLLTINPLIRLGASTGFLGAFTTFSTFTMESIRLFEAEQYWYFGTYVSFSVFLGIAMSAFGLIVARAAEQWLTAKQQQAGSFSTVVKLKMEEEKAR